VPVQNSRYTSVSAGTALLRTGGMHEPYRSSISAKYRRREDDISYAPDGDVRQWVDGPLPRHSHALTSCFTSVLLTPRIKANCPSLPVRGAYTAESAPNQRANLRNKSKSELRDSSLDHFCFTT
jgi:hypothetical protein